GVGGEPLGVETRGELGEAERQIRNRGSSRAVRPPDELSELRKEEGAVDRRFSKEMISSLDRWLDMADGKLKGGEIPCLLNGGNGDNFEIEAGRHAPPPATVGEGRGIRLGGFPPGSRGGTNPTAWNPLPEAADADRAPR